VTFGAPVVAGRAGSGYGLPLGLVELHRAGHVWRVISRSSGLAGATDVARPARSARRSRAGAGERKRRGSAHAAGPERASRPYKRLSEAQAPHSSAARPAQTRRTNTCRPAHV